MKGITGALSSQELNKTGKPQVKLTKNHSLPNLLCFSMDMVKKCNVSFTEEESNEQPVDFSKKYSETKPPTSTYNKVVKSYNKTFSMYAETDLDQPTDYSLRYAEDDSDSDDCNQLKSENENTEFVQDTVKTYCTEDTPYETPFNFSTSTSMSDLRIDDKTANIEPKNPSNVSKNHKKPIKNEPKAVKFEEIVNYTEETPLMFSRSSSLASLDSIEQHSIHDDHSSVISDFR